VLDLGREHGWFDSPLIITLSIVATLALLSLLIWESAEPYPVIDLSLFRDRAFSFGVAVISLGMVSFSVIGVIFPLWMQTVMVIRPCRRAWRSRRWASSPRVSLLIGVFLDRLDARFVTSFDSRVLAVLYWDTHFTLSMSFWQIVTPTFIQGIGLPCFFIPLSAVTLSRISDEKLAAASGMSNFLRTLSAALGTALASRGGITVPRIITARWRSRHARVSRHGAVRPRVAEHGTRGDRNLAAIRQVVQQQAYMMATNDLFYVASLVCLALAVLIWTTRPWRGISAARVGH